MKRSASYQVTSADPQGTAPADCAGAGNNLWLLTNLLIVVVACLPRRTIDETEPTRKSGLRMDNYLIQKHQEIALRITRPSVRFSPAGSW